MGDKMDICLVSGSQKPLGLFTQTIEGLPQVNGKVTFKFHKIKDLTNEIVDSGITFLTTADVVFISDFGFSSKDPDDRLTELKSLQDVLNTKSYTRKVYLLTKDSELYKILRNPDAKDDNFIYVNTKAFIYEGKLKKNLIKDILLGKMDSSGESHADFGRIKERANEEDILNAIGGYDSNDDTNEISESRLKFGTETVSDVNVEEYINSPQHSNKLKKEQRQKGREADLEARRRRQVASRGANITEEDSIVNPNHIYVNEDDISAARVKIVADKGVLAVTGIDGAGASGIVSNIAEMYDIVDSKVAVLDLDIFKRYQSIYFGEYEETAEEGKGLVSLVNNYKSSVLDGVNVGGNIDVYSIKRSEVISSSFETELLERLPAILENLQTKYDVVVIDFPLNLVGEIDFETAQSINGVLFVTENLTFKLEDLFILNLRNLRAINKEVVDELLYKSYIAYNKYVEGRAGFEEGEKCDDLFIKGLISNLNRPYSHMEYITHIPFDVRWERQIVEDIRWIERAVDNEKTITYLLGGIVFK